ncbi:MAG: putative RDD family membrane protein YckC [Crocinitomix sp.]|jgi:uncharacterized RDD family membrane protein YckC
MLYQEPYPNNLPLAPEGSRMINFFIDLIISTAISSVIVKISLLPPPVNDYPILTLVIIAAVFTLIRLFYYFIFEAFLGGTIGQRLTKSQIVTIDKDVPTLKQYIVRSLSRPITGAGSFVSDDLQSFHDKNSKTYVITKETSSELDLV